jgi:hypothetical protein
MSTVMLVGGILLVLTALTVEDRRAQRGWPAGRAVSVAMGSGFLLLGGAVFKAGLEAGLGF